MSSTVQKKLDELCVVIEKSIKNVLNFGGKNKTDNEDEMINDMVDILRDIKSMVQQINIEEEEEEDEEEEDEEEKEYGDDLEEEDIESDLE
jgi:hypothetical protein